MLQQYHLCHQNGTHLGAVSNQNAALRMLPSSNNLHDINWIKSVAIKPHICNTDSACMTKVRTCAASAAPLVQLSSTRLEWSIVKYHNAICSRYNNNMPILSRISLPADSDSGADRTHIILIVLNSRRGLKKTLLHNCPWYFTRPLTMGTGRGSGFDGGGLVKYHGKYATAILFCSNIPWPTCKYWIDWKLDKLIIKHLHDF